jgi:hypothetical protein
MHDPCLPPASDRASEYPLQCTLQLMVCTAWGLGLDTFVRGGGGRCRGGHMRSRWLGRGRMQTVQHGGSLAAMLPGGPTGQGARQCCVPSDLIRPPDVTGWRPPQGASHGGGRHAAQRGGGPRQRRLRRRRRRLPEAAHPGVDSSGDLSLPTSSSATAAATWLCENRVLLRRTCMMREDGRA